MPLTLQAPAKVNLSLAVSYPPVSYASHGSFHTLRSVFATINLFDTLSFESIPAGECNQNKACALTKMGTPVVLRCARLDIPTTDNLAFRALDCMEQKFALRAVPRNCALKLSIDKRIPHGGGLGGGSSDAACVIGAYARQHKIKMDDARILELARRLGADVSFFLYGGCALMEGRGDVFVKRLPVPDLPLVLMGDQRALSTARVYASFDAAPVASQSPDLLADFLINSGGRVASFSDELARLCANNLEEAACTLFPELARRLAFVRAQPQTLCAQVSGSGATCFALCKTISAAEALSKKLEPLCDWVLVNSFCLH